MQYSIDNKVAKQKGLFKPLTVATEVPFQLGSMTSVDANEELIAVGCSSCNNNFGEIVLYDSISITQLPHKIRGDPKTGKKVGKTVLLQKDQLAEGNRIWYSTEDSVIAASLVTYEGEQVFEDEIFVQVQDDVSSNLAFYQGHFLISTENDDGDGTQLVSFSACASGKEYTYSAQNAMKSRTCMECDVGYYSLGWNTECIECSYLDRADLEYYYETNLIDNGCFEDDILIETIRAVYAGNAGVIVVVILIPLLLLAICIGGGLWMCKNDKCCNAFYLNCPCCIPKKYRKQVEVTNQKNETKDMDDFDDINSVIKQAKQVEMQMEIDSNKKEKQKDGEPAKYSSMTSIKLSPNKEGKYEDNTQGNGQIFVQEGGDIAARPTMTPNKHNDRFKLTIKSDEDSVSNPSQQQNSNKADGPHQLQSGKKSL